MINGKDKFEEGLKGLQLARTSSDLKKRILCSASTLALPPVSFTDRVWASRALRISYVSLILFLAIAALFSDRKVGRIMAHDFQKDRPASAAQHETIACELGFDEAESRAMIRYRIMNKQPMVDASRWDREREILFKEL